MFNPSMFDNSRPDGFGVLEVEPDGVPVPDTPRLFVPLKRTELAGEVTGPLADLRLTQIFGYTAEQCDKTLEAVYRFPLPGDAAVTGVTARFGEVEIRAELKERERAEADYEEAKKQGRQAALATRESPDVFTLRVAGLMPDQEIRVETSYVQLARMEGQDWTLRIPLTTSPRYVREDEANSRHAQGQPLALLRDPGHRFALDLLVRDAAGVASPTHALSAIAEDGALRVRLSDNEVLPDRDCVLNWRAAQESQHPALHLYLHDDRAAGQAYFLALAAPPAQPAARQNVPRESILLVDHSGSMSGPKWEAADWAVKQFLGGLGPQDTFALGLFHDSTRWFADRPRNADPATVAAAIQFLERAKDSGGTNLGVALEQALGQKRSGDTASRHVLVLTDAEVSDAGRILRLAEGESQRADRRRISVLCVDAAPNSFLARELAERGGGIAKFLTSQPEEEDITTALDRILEDWSAPVLTGLRLEVNRPDAEAVGRAVLPGPKAGGSAIDVGDLPAGRAVWIAGRVPRGESPELAFRLTTAQGKEVAARRCDLNANGDRPALKALFGASKVLGLEFLTTAYYDEKQLHERLRRMGYDPDRDLKAQSSGSSVYAENVQKDTQAGMRGLLAREALNYGLACSETAFIAVRTEAGKPVEETAVVANALPSGWSDQFVMRGITNVRARSAPNYAAGAMAAAMAPPPPSPQASAPVSMDLAEDLDVPAFLRQHPPAAKASLRNAGGGLVNAVMGMFSAGAAAPAQSGTDQGRTQPSRVSATALYSGRPAFAGREAALFDSAGEDDAKKLPGAGTFSRLTVEYVGDPPDVSTLDVNLVLLLYIDDMAAPRARVRLADLLRQGGSRPLNLRRQGSQRVRVTLEDPNGVWKENAPEIRVMLE